MCFFFFLVAAWALGIVHSLFQLEFIVNFCGPNVFEHLYCDLPWLLRLACTDRYLRLYFMLTVNCGFICVRFFLNCTSLTFSLCLLFGNIFQVVHPRPSPLCQLTSFTVVFFFLWSNHVCLCMATPQFTDGQVSCYF